jgi:3-phenylpropionate/trans-cinnamate dioxygenase ferredoxin subunit
MRHVVAGAREIPPGSRKVVTVGGRDIVVFNVGGEYFALANRCPHQGGRLCDGKLVGLVASHEPGRYDYSRPHEIIRCPWHGWEFDLRTGRSNCEPARIRTRAYEVLCEPAEESGPLVAETFPVIEQDRRVLVEVPG